MHTPKKRRITLGLIVSAMILLTLGAITWWMSESSRSSHSTSGSLEVREYQLIVLPLDGTNFEARKSQIKFRLSKPGQAKIIELATKGAKPLSLQESLVELGYDFPPGTYVSQGSCSNPGMFVRHYPEILDRLEVDFQLERSP